MPLFRRLALFLLVFAALVLGVGIGMRVEDRRLSDDRAHLERLVQVNTGTGVVAGDPEDSVDLTLLWSTWRLLQETYLAPDDLQKGPMVYGAVRGLVDALGDPYTLFMDPVETRAFNESLAGTLEGIGAQLDMRDGWVTVVAPVRGSPAAAAGLLPGDIITDVDQTSVVGMRLEDVVQRIRGPRGTVVTLRIERAEEEARTLSITRATLQIPSVETSWIPSAKGRLFHIIINQFGDDTVDTLQAALSSEMRPDVRGIILDVRSNGGGYLEGAVDVVSMFMDTGAVVTVHRRDTSPETRFVSGHAVASEVPMVVLVDGGSASAAEIVAGALMDAGRATLIGTQTFGKGTVQELLDLPGGSALRVTIAKWLTPGGHDLAKVGLTPSLIVPRTADDVRAGKDPQLAAAVEALE